MEVNRQKHYRVCNLCEAMCGLVIEHDGQQVLHIRGDESDPLSKGSICPKGAHIHELHEDPDRLKKPLRKTEGGEWEEISWKQALDIVGEKINEVRKNHGKNAVGLYLGNPTVHNFGMMLFAGEFKRILETRNSFSPTTMDQLPHHFIGYYMFGHPLSIPIPDIDRTEYLIILGANPIASNGSLMSGCGPNRRIRAIQDKGGKAILLDPRANETSRIVDEHYVIRPGTDIYFLLGMLHVIQQNNWTVVGELEKHIAGLDKLEQIAEPYDPEKVSAITGVAAEVIRRITKEYVLQDKAVIYGRMGMSTQEHGGLCHWLSTVINILTGHFDKPGGAMFTRPAMDIKRTNTFHQAHGRWHSRVRGLPEFEGELPVSTMAEEMLTPGEGQIKALITYAGNPALSTPNAKRLEEALPNLDFMVSIDIFLNETTRHANIILPPPSHLEIDHYDLIFNQISVSNNAKFSQALFKPKEGQLYDWQIAKELIRRFAKGSNKKPSKIFQWLSPRQILNLGLMTGPYGKLSHPKRWFSGLSLKKVIDSRHGIGLGSLVPMIPEVLLTEDRKINIADPVFIEGLEKVKRELVDHPYQALTENDFLLIGRRHLRSNNSWMHNVPGLMKGKNRCTVMMHPQDAERLVVIEGQEVFVQSATGEISLPVEITDGIMPGVLSIPHGFGHTKKGTRLAVASQAGNAGVSVNDITDQKRLDPVTGNAAFSGQVVQVQHHSSKDQYDKPK